MSAQTTTEWWVLGHPGWPDGIDFRTAAEAERFYWSTPKLDGTREGIRIRRKDVVRYEPYVPQPAGRDFAQCSTCQGGQVCYCTDTGFPTSPQSEGRES